MNVGDPRCSAFSDESWAIWNESNKCKAPFMLTLFNFRLMMKELTPDAGGQLEDSAVLQPRRMTAPMMEGVYHIAFALALPPRPMSPCWSAILYQKTGI
jgi:hypothetical protein